MGKTPTPRFLPKAAPATGSSQDAAPVEDRTTDNNNVAIRTMMDIRPCPCWLVIGERLWLSWSLLSTRPSTKPKLKRTCLGREQAFLKVSVTVPKQTQRRSPKAAPFKLF
jgi:hypothetical protein